MLAIVVTHPIQYQVPLWQRLAAGSVPFEVWYLSEHASLVSRDREFGKDFSWDLEMLSGYPHRFIHSPSGATPNTPLKLRSTEAFVRLFDRHKVSHVWVMGWQVAAYWQAVWAAHVSGRQVWLRGESNAMAPSAWWKEPIKRPLLGAFFRRVDQFLCIGSANRELYRNYGVPEEKLHMALYAVDNQRFAAQAEAAKGHRSEIRRQWGIPSEAFCILFCGKFIPKKRPMDLIAAGAILQTAYPALKTHLLFVGSGELGMEMRAQCNAFFDAENPRSAIGNPQSKMPSASFAGFLNQTEISRAYVAADVLVLPSDYGETWGLVVNEAMASGLPSVISDHCGCAQDLGLAGPNEVFDFGNSAELAEKISLVRTKEASGTPPPSLIQTLQTVNSLYRSRSSTNELI